MKTSKFTDEQIALALNQHVAGKWRGPATVDNHRVDDQYPVHGLLLEAPR